MELAQVLSKLKADSMSNIDYVVPLAINKFRYHNNHIKFDKHDMELTMHSLKQLCAWVGLSYTAFSEIPEEFKDSLLQNAIERVAHENVNMLIRTKNGKIRSILKDVYQRLDNADLFECLAQVLSNMTSDIKIVEFGLEDEILCVSLIYNDRIYDVLGEDYYIGLKILNSEVDYTCLIIEHVLYNDNRRIIIPIKLPTTLKLPHNRNLIQRSFFMSLEDNLDRSKYYLKKKVLKLEDLYSEVLTYSTFKDFKSALESFSVPVRIASRYANSIKHSDKDIFYSSNKLSLILDLFDFIKKYDFNKSPAFSIEKKSSIPSMISEVMIPWEG